MENQEIQEIIKTYPNKAEADKDNLLMKKQGFIWFTGWYCLSGFTVTYVK